MDKHLLDTLTNEYRELLIKKCEKENLNNNEIINFDNKIKNQFFEYTTKNKISISIRAYRSIKVSLMYIFMGLIFYVFSTGINSLTLNNSHEIDLLSNLMKLTGLFISLLGIFSLTLTIFKEKISIFNPTDFSTNETSIDFLEKSNKSISFEIITLWNYLESAIYEEQSNSNISPIRYIMENDSLTDVEKKHVRSLLQLRNNIVHQSSNELTYDKNDIDTLFFQINKIIEKIKNTNSR